MEPALFTLDKDGYPLLDGKRIPCITSCELTGDPSGIYDLAIRITVRLDPKFHFVDEEES